MTTILSITEEDFDSAVDIARPILQSGGIIVYPTDTVYGIGGDATSEEVVKKIHEIKGTSSDKPLSVMVGDFGTIDYYCDTGLWEDIILKKYLPGPYTFLMKRRRPLAASKTGKLGIRLPDSTFCQLLCQKFGKPIITTSANISGKNPPDTLQEVEKSIIDTADVAIDGGQTKYGGASVIVDLVERKLIRTGLKEIDLVEFPER
jgi:L-threonylcarbamoyladenylate synthase